MKSTLLYTIFSLVFIANIQAQSNYDSLLRAKADSMIYYYARYGSFTENDRNISKQYIKDFGELFTKNAAVYNDILKEEYSETLLSVNEYSISTSEKFPSGITISIDKKEYGDINRFPDKDKGSIEVQAEKEVLGMTIDDDFFDKSFDITFLINFNLDLSNFKISGIRERKIENKSITLKVLNAKNGSTVKNVKINLYYNNELQQTRISDYQGNITFSDIPPKSLVTLAVSKDEDYVMEKGKDWIIEDWINGLVGQRQILLSRVKEWTKFSLEVFGTPSLTHIKSVNATTNYNLGSFTNNSEFGYGLGVGASYAVFANKKIAISIGTGIGLDIYNSNIVFTNYTQNKKELLDPESDKYELNVTSNEISDELTLTYITVPLNINFRKNINNNIIDYVFINVGAEYGYLAENSSNITGHGTFFGYYHKIGNDVVNVDIHDVKDLNFLDDEPLTQKSEMTVSNMNLSAIASLGVSIKIVEDILNLDIALDVNYGIKNISDYTYQDYYFAKEGYSPSPNYESLVGSGSHLSTQSFGARIGFTYNIFK